MEPLNDKELNQLLRQWEAPAAPATLRIPISSRRQSFWHWLLSGRIHIPVPVGLALVVATAAVLIYSNRTVPSPISPSSGNAVAPAVAPAPQPFSPDPPAVSTPPAERETPVSPSDRAPATAALSGFQPVRQLELKILREQP